MPLDGSIVRRFALRDDPTEAKGPRGQIVEAIQRSSFTIEFISDEDKPYALPEQLRRGDSFGIFLKPRQEAKRLYGLDREVLLWCSTYPTFQARDIEALRRVLDGHGTRLSRQFAILATDYDPSTRSDIESESDIGITLVHVSLEQVRKRGLESLLSQYLYSRDLFDVAGATVRAADFFGRRELVDRLIGEIETGASQTGVFGLRKVGKTSLLNRLADRLRGSGKCTVARLDLQWTVSINPQAEYTLWALGASIYASHRSIRAIDGFRLFGRYDTFSDIEASDRTWEWFAHDIRLLLEQTRRRFCILIDEIERMYESPSERGFVRFWQLLRGLDQMNPGRLRYVVGGTSPQCAELGSISGEDNPLFRYLRLEYLGPLSPVDAVKLLESLGGTMGLRFSKEALTWAIDESGGHPALLRTLGSAVHQHFRDRRVPVDVDAAALTGISNDFMQRSASILDQMMSALEDQYHDEYSLLTHLAQGQIFQFRELAELFPSEVRHLRDYGLVAGSEPAIEIRIRVLHTHLMARARGKDSRPFAYQVLGRGDRIGQWKILNCLASGAYGDVYEVATGEFTYAAKVLRAGQLSALQREVDILRDIRHPGVVKFVDALRSDDGSPCLVMEMLHGQDMAHYCSPSTVPALPDWSAWLLQVLDALAFIHPKRGVIKSFESREALSSAEFLAWDQARHGYVHRDVKPENIMIVPSRGAVLIDFNIAVRAGAPVRTTSYTPGYLSTIPSVWDPAVDIYATGISFLELAAGQRLVNSTVEELREIVKRRSASSVVSALDMLLVPSEQRYTAAEIRSALLRSLRH